MAAFVPAAPDRDAIRLVAQAPRALHQHRTTATGQYRVRGFKKDINVTDVTISCSKDGYKQLRVVRLPLRKPIKSVEIECRLQKL